MESPVRYVQRAIRQWSRSPLVGCLALLSLTLGIGAVTALVAVVDALHVRPLPTANAPHLVRLCGRSGSGDVTDSVYSLDVWDAIRRYQPVFAGVAAAAPSERVRLVHGGEAEFVQASYVSGTFFNLLGVPMARGRHLRPADENGAAVPVAVVDHAFWRDRLAAAPDVIGKTVVVGNVPVQIVGVTAPGFFGVEVGRRVQIYLPLRQEGLTAQGRREASGAGPVRIFGTLHDGQRFDEARKALQTWQPMLRRAGSSSGAGLDEELTEAIDVVSAARGVSTLRRELRLPLTLLLCGAGLILLLACVNVAALMSARFADRRSDLWMHRALGASTGQLVAELAAETLALTGAGALLGVALALWLTRALVPALVQPSAQAQMPYLAVALDARLLLVAAVLGLFTGLVTGLPPGVAAARATASTGAGAPRGDRTVGGSQRVVMTLVAMQLALSLVLVSTAGVLVRSFLSLTLQPTGLDLDRVLLATLDGPVFDPEPRVTISRLEALCHRLGSVGGVESVSVSTVTPLEGMIILTRLEVPGHAPRASAERVTPVNRVTPGFFSTFGIKSISGRLFEARDGADAAPVAVVNRAFEDRYFAGRGAVGRMIKVGGRDLQVIGVAADAKYLNLREATTAVVYRPLAQCITADPQPLRIAIRAQNPDGVRRQVLQELQRFDGRLSVEFRTLADEVGSSVQRDRMLAWTGALLGILALGLAAVGLYAAFSNLVARRHAEIAVRMALGASPASVSRLVLRAASLVVGAGCALGAVGIVISSRFVQSLAFGVKASDPVGIAATFAVLLTVAGMATFVPVRRAALVDPIETLRSQ